MQPQIEGQINILELALVLRRRIRLVILSIAVVFGLALLYLVGTTPLFTARTLLLVDPAQKNLLQSDQSGSLNPGIASSIIESEVEILRSDTVLIEAVRGANLMSDSEFGVRVSFLEKAGQAVGLATFEEADPETLVKQTLGRVRSAVSARRKGLTNLIELSFTSEDPKRAAELANLIAETYIDLQIRAKSRNFLDARDVLTSQLSAAQDALTRSDRALTAYLDENLGELSQIAGSASVKALQRRLDALNAERLSAQVGAEAAENALAAQNWEELTSQLQSDALSALESERRTLLDRLGQTETDSVAALDLRAELAKIDERLQREGGLALSGMRDEITRIDASSSELRGQIRSELLTGSLPPETLSAIYALQREAAIAQTQYDTLLSRIRELEAQSATQISDTRIVSPASVPLHASSPNAKLVLALALIGSLGIGVGLSLLGEFYFGGINSANQLKNVIPTRLGSVIPKEVVKPNQLSPADIVLDAKMSRYAESLRRLRANIDSHSPIGDGNCRLIMVTSALPAEGKSVMALSLARTYSESGKAVLLIDADLRKPSIHTLLGFSTPSGLFEYLVSESEEGESIECYDFDPRAPVGVIFGRQGSGVPTDLLLQTETFRNLISDTRDRFDVIIVDTPPLIPVVDTRYIAPLADCAIFCVRTGETGQAEARNAFEQLAEYTRKDTPVLTALTNHPGYESGYRQTDYY